MAVPLHNERAGERTATLIDRHAEGGHADGTGQRTGKGRTWRGRRRGHNEAQGRCRGLRLGGLADEKNRPSGLLGPAMQAPGRGKVELFRIAAQLDNYGGKGGKRCSLLGHPQCVEELRHLAEQECFGSDTELMSKARRIRKACFPENLGRTDPEQGQVVVGCLEDQAGKCKREASRQPRIARLRPVDLDEGGFRQTAAQRTIQPFDAGGEKCLLVLRNRATAQNGRLRTARAERLRQAALDLRDFVTQGKNSLSRHGVARHDSRPSRIVPVMFLWIPELHARVKRTLKEFIPVGSIDVQLARFVRLKSLESGML